MPNRPPSSLALWSQFWLTQPERRLLLLRLLSLLFLALFATQWFRLDKDLAGAHRKVATNAEVAYVAPVDAMRIASLGNQGFVADLLFLRAAHYFVEHLITDSRMPWIDLYMQAVWGLDAHLKQSYRWAAQVIKFGQRIDDDVARRANHFARLGLAYFPEDPWLYHEIAFNLRYAVATKDDAEQKRQRDLALQYLEIAYSFPGFALDPNYLVTQMARAGHGDDSVQATLDTYAQATEEQRMTLRALLDERHKSALSSELAWLDQAQQRDFPWAPPTLALMLGAKRQLTPPLDATKPELWMREPPTPADLRQRLGVRATLAPDRGGYLPDELAGRDLPEPVTKDAR